MVPNVSTTGPVVIVGGGFAGLTTALALSRSKPRPPIILIEPRSRFVFLPLLYEVLSGELQAWEVAPTYKSLLCDRGIVLIEDFVLKVDTNDQKVITASGLILRYAQIVLGTGSRSNDFGVPGVNEHALMFQQLEDVDSLRKCIHKLKGSIDKEKTLVIVGAGSTGVELACKLADLLDNEVHVHLIEMGERVLRNGKSFNQEQVEKALQLRGVEVHLNTKVLAIHSDKIELENTKDNELKTSFLMYSALVWVAGTKPSLPSLLPVQNFKDCKLQIDQYLCVKGFKNVLALGDAAFNEEYQWSATAQVAIQQGEAAAKILKALRESKKPEPFEFHDYGEMLSLGIGEATITGLGLTLAGSLAFRIRRMAYLTRMPNFALGIRSAGAWLLDT